MALGARRRGPGRRAPPVARPLRTLAAAGLALAIPFVTVPSAADTGAPLVVWPTLTPAGDDASSTPLHRPTAADHTLIGRAQELDATLRDAAADLGFTLDLADPGPEPGAMRDADILDRAKGHAAGGTTGTWVVSARLEPAGGDSFVERIVAVPPNGRELRVRVETVKDADVSVRGLVMLRDLLSPAAAAQAEATQREQERVDTTARVGLTNPVRSPGRAVLSVNAAVFGGYTAYSIQSASGSQDPRVLYPLLALGTGIGLGTALLVSEEWDVSTGAAWYLAAGAWWGAASGVLIANGSHVASTENYSFGIGTGLGGIALSTFALTRSRMDEGDAVLTHSGAALGFLVGSAVEMAYRGTTTITPYTGSGYGTAAGLLGAGTLAVFVQVSPSRVMLVDLGAGLGALAGAAAGSPLIVKNTSPAYARGFLGATVGGTLAGGAVTLWLTRDAKKPKAASLLPIPGQPLAGVIGESATRTGSVPVLGLGWSGNF